MRRGAAVWLVVLGACGDNSTGDDGPPPLVEDPAVLAGCTPAPPAAGSSRAKRVVCDEELVAGRMAAGRPGDLLLENAAIRAIIRGPGDGFYLYGTTGGALIDAARHGADDLLQEIVPLVELNSGQFSELVITEAGDDGAAEITVRGVAEPTPLFASALGTERANVIVEQRYRLAPDDIAIAIETRIYSEPDAGDANPLLPLLDVLFVGGRIELRFPGRADDDTRGPFLASSGGTTSYAIVWNRDDSALTTLVELAFFKLLESPTVAVDGDPLTRHLVVGDGSLSSVVDRSWEIYGEPTARVTGTSGSFVDVVVRRESGVIETIARSGDDGAFSFAVPLGTYSISAEADNRATAAPTMVDATRDVDNVSVEAGPTGAISVAVTVDGAPSPARVEAIGVDESAGIRRELYADAAGNALVPVPPGVYTVNVSKGMEHDAFTATDVVVAPEGDVALSAALATAIDTSGWISIDPHMHSEMSIDSSVPLETRLLSVAGEGVEVAVSSDHDFIVDYAPVAAALGLDGQLATISGQESSSLIIGHVNAWPTPRDPDRPGAGALPWYQSGPSTVFELARAGDSSRIVQVNHPWEPLGLFTAIDFDGATLMATRSGADLGIPGADLNDFSFDALEVANKKTEDSFELAFRDWLALVSSGLRIAATGASDSHGDDAYIGEARTFVFLGAGADDPATLDRAALNAAIRNQRAVVAQGIFLTAGVVGAAGATSVPGDLVDQSLETEATLRVRVQAPPWLPVGSVVIYERTTEIMRIPVDPLETQPIRFEADIALPLGSADTLFVVVAEPAGDGRPVMDEPKPSFTNPVYIDANGDGVYTP